MTKGHWSDCAVNNAPAYEPGPCDCGGLDLAAYERYVAVTALIPSPGSLARFIENGILPSLVEAKQPPRRRVAPLAPTPDLPSSHDGVVVAGGPNGMDFNNAGEATVGYPKALPIAQSITCNVPPHTPHSDSLKSKNSTRKDGGTNA